MGTGSGTGIFKTTFPCFFFSSSSSSSSSVCMWVGGGGEGEGGGKVQSTPCVRCEASEKNKAQELRCTCRS